MGRPTLDREEPKNLAPLDHPRWIFVLPNGDVLFVESATVPSPPRSIMDRLGKFMERNSRVVRPCRANSRSALRPEALRVRTRGPCANPAVEVE